MGNEMDSETHNYMNTSTSSSNDSPVVQRRHVRRLILDDSDSDSGSSIDLQPHRRKIPRVSSEDEDTDDSDSSDSFIIRRHRGATRLPSESSGCASDTSDGQSDKCPICLLSFRQQQIGTPESCKHRFCVDCLMEWSKTMNTCPVDRMKYEAILVHRSIDCTKVVERRPITAPSTPPPEENDQATMENAVDTTLCEICGSGDREDRMLLCDGCDLGFHMDCLDPPIDDVPVEAWFCEDCLTNVGIGEQMTAMIRDLFGYVDRIFPTARSMMPRTRQTERLRRRIAENRLLQQRTAPIQESATTSNNQRKRRRKRKKTRTKTRYRTVYTIDEATGETVSYKKKCRRRRKRKRTKRRNVEVPQNSRQHLIKQLGICPLQHARQTLPEMRVQYNPTAHNMRLTTNIPRLDMFGTGYDYLTPSDDDDANDETTTNRNADYYNNNAVLLARRRMAHPTRFTPANKNCLITSVSSTTNDLLDTILESQERLHSKSKRVDLYNFDRCLKQHSITSTNGNGGSSSGGGGGSATTSSSASSTNIDRPTGSNGGGEAYTTPTSTVETSNQINDNDVAGVSYNQDNITNSDKISDDKTENDTDLDIYSDIETVSTTKLEDTKLDMNENDGKMLQTDDEMDSESDMVIDTDKVTATPEEEQTIVTSTVDLTNRNENQQTIADDNLVIQSETIQSSNHPMDDEDEAEEEEEDSEDGCPNFSIYSKESINLAKNTDVFGDLQSTSSNQVEEVSSTPLIDEPHMEDSIAKKPIKIGGGGGLYSDSEDENVVKKLHQQSNINLPDLKQMTEDISEDERSYTPCLDERPIGLDGLDTEMISDEENRNDFDETHETKNATDGATYANIISTPTLTNITTDTLEINAKESEMELMITMKPDDYEEGEIVGERMKKKLEKSKNEEENEEEKTKNVEKTKENDGQLFKKLSKSTKERNYRDRDKERSRSRSAKKSKKRDERKRDKRKELERYDVRAVIAEKPRQLKDKFGRDIVRKSHSPRSRSSRSRSRKRRRTRSRSKKKSTSTTSRRDRSKAKTRKARSRTRSRSRRRAVTPQSPKRKWPPTTRRWSPTLSRSRSPAIVEPQRHLSPSWTPPRRLDVKQHNLTVILTNDQTSSKKSSKKEKKRSKSEKKSRENGEKKKQSQPQPSKEVFASGDNILVSVSFNKEKKKTEKPQLDDELQTSKKTSGNGNRKKNRTRKSRDLSGIKPMAIIDLENSPAKELTPSPQDIIVLSDSDTEMNQRMNPIDAPSSGQCDSSSLPLASPERAGTSSGGGGPKTPPEPQVKFTLNPKPAQIRAITNPLHEPDEMVVGVDEDDDDDDDEEGVMEKNVGPNTPPEPPNSPPSSPDAYDPFEPTKSRSVTPEPSRDISEIDTEEVLDKNQATTTTTTIVPSELVVGKTPPIADVQPADSQSSSINATPESTKSPPTVTPASAAPTLPPPQATMATTSMATPTTHTSTVLPTVPRLNILNSTILTPATFNTSPAIKMARRSLSRGSDGNNDSMALDSPYSPGSSDYEDLFEPPMDNPKKMVQPKKSPAKLQNAFDNLFGSSPTYKTGNTSGSGTCTTSTTTTSSSSKFGIIKKAPLVPNPVPLKSKGITQTKQVGVKLDEDNLKILDELPNSAVEMQIKDKFLKKLNRQERVVEEVKLVLKPHYNKKHINKEEYKDILRRAVPKICHNKSGEINPTKIKNLIEAYVKKVRHSKKVTSSSSVNTQKV